MVEIEITEETVEGKQVVDASGAEVGTVKAVRDGTPIVDPDPGIADTIKTKLGWDDVDPDDYPLPESAIERITDDTVHLRRTL